MRITSWTKRVVEHKVLTNGDCTEGFRDAGVHACKPLHDSVDLSLCRKDFELSCSRTQAICPGVATLLRFQRRNWCVVGR